PGLAKETDLHARLLAVLHAKLEVIEPFHRFSGLLFNTAADPKSPLNPFGEESTEARDAGIALMAQVMEGSDLRIPSDIQERLPELLWLYSMGIVLYWIHDESEGRARTHRLVEHSSDLVVRIIKLLSNPLLRPLRKSALKMLDDLQ
ncbi:MAG: TetR family transcriptional regulator C-terminal domain-containing protein, partial [Planctomycetota bacterium]